MNTIKENILALQARINKAKDTSARSGDDVLLLAVSKTKPVEAIIEAMGAGQRAFGENYVQEGTDKVQYFSEHFPQQDLEWHFIGPIQSNKTRPVAENFSWVHTVDRAKIAQRLNDQRPDNLPPLQVLIQVNTSGESSKSGISENEIAELARLISSLPNLTLRGLMSIPENVSDHHSQFAAFHQLATIQKRLQADYPSADTLSMGMTGDMEAAIEAGSTIVRIGTAIFGARDYRPGNSRPKEQ
ncbi:YggS family pyridoxal phosphate-dependent enzyme [Vibrio quintilis]|uniref:Pyridoxal phosphate homeostasis protein n=1 Tax=Vibrio quintilis TaxID=1117707 RepID=A0A1M7Z2L5_9VIBR|nr:YggS family pyridoxal phosphate-dependent enzyme [Vibrio quintilis]SHO59198.1 hypothetical protein VQ7734_04978 [Vibrio quintilis]